MSKTFDLSTLNLSAGTHHVTVKARASGYADSVASIEVSYQVGEEHTPTKGLAYTLSDDGTYYTCTGIGTATDTDIVIASEIGGVPVAEIADYAFRGNRVTSLIIQDNVRKIGNYAFENNYMSKLIIGKDVTSIGEGAFKYSGYFLTLVVPDKVISIGAGAFYGNENMSYIVLPDSVTSIGDYAFYNCDGLMSVYYKGTASEWSGISIAAYNTPLYTATRYYYSETQPTTSGKYWHYDENGKIAVW